MSVVVASYNAPHRLRPHTKAMQELADAGADIICAQEHTDRDDWRPKGWRRYRPSKAQSNTIYWNPRTVRPKKRGARRLSSPGFRSLRYGVWVAFKTDIGTVRVMGVHLPAFYKKSETNAREYDKQVKKVARWAAGGRYRVVAGDFNGSVGNRRMRPLEDVLRFSTPKPTGPAGQKIDYVATSRTGRLRPGLTRLGPRGNSDHAPVLVTLSR